MKLYSICISGDEFGFSRFKRKCRDIDDFKMTSHPLKEHANIDPAPSPMGNECSGKTRVTPRFQHVMQEESQRISTCTRSSHQSKTTRCKPVLGVRAKILQNIQTEKRTQSAIVTEECGNIGTVEQCFFENVTKFKRGSYPRRTVRKAVHPFNQKDAVGA